MPQLVHGLAGISGRVGTAVLADIITSQKSAYEVDFDNGARSVRMDFRAAEPLTVALAADCCRLSTSAIQSLSSIESELVDKTLMPWSLVKLYYSAFYAGNTLTRILGAGCAYLDRAHVSKIIAIGSAYGRSPSFPVEAGLYRCTIDTTATQITYVKLGTSAGGSHNLFWGEFVRSIRETNAKLLSGTLPMLDAQNVFSKLADLERHFAQRGNAWLSKIRNEIQYQHAYEVWFQCGIGKKDRQVLGRLASKWSADPMGIDLHLNHGALGDFINTCVFITATCHALTLKISAAGGGRSKSFIHFGPAAFLNEFSGA